MVDCIGGGNGFQAKGVPKGVPHQMVHEQVLFQLSENHGSQWCGVSVRQSMSTCSGLHSLLRWNVRNVWFQDLFGFQNQKKSPTPGPPIMGKSNLNDRNFNVPQFWKWNRY